MRISGPHGSAATAAGSAPRRTSGGTFSLGGHEAARSVAAPPTLQTVGGIDALIALQGLEDPRERRGRAVRRGRHALDILDELKVGLLSDTLDQSTLLRLKTAAAGIKDSSGDPALDEVLAEIDLRVEVELAKSGLK